MHLLRLALPAALLLYFVWRARRQRIFLLGIPFLMYASQSLFFDKLKPFWIPGRLSTTDHVLMWLVIVWILYFDLLLPTRWRTVKRPRVFGPALSAPEEVVLLGIAAWVVIELGFTVLRFSDLGSALGEAKGFIYLFVGYFLLRGMLCQASRDDTLDFIKVLILANTAAAGLFFLHQGLHLHLYDATEYKVLTFMGQTLTRSFTFMPQFSLLALAYCYARRDWGLLWVGVLIVTLAALWVSYTRSLLAIAAVELLAILLVRLSKSHQAGMAIKRGLSIVAILVVLGGVAFVALPAQSGYFLSRIHMATGSGSVTGDPNLQNRIDKLRTVWGWIGPEGHFTGQGFATASQDPPGANIPWMASDLVWVPWLYRLGLVGVALLVALYALAGWRMLDLAVTGADDAEFLALVLFGALVGSFLESAVSWTLLNPDRYAMGLWAFALVAAEACRRRAESVASLPPEPLGA